MSKVVTAVLLGVGVTIWFWLPHIGWARWWWEVPAASSRLHARVQNQFADREDIVADTPNLDDAISKHHNAKVEKAHYDNAIDNFQRSCPDQFRHDEDWTHVTMDLRGCKTGAPIQLQFKNNDVFQTTRWKATLKRYRQDGSLKDSLEEPVIKVRQDNPDGFSSVKQVTRSPDLYVYEWKGFVKFVHEDSSDYLELIRQ